MKYYEWIIKARDESAEGVASAQRKMNDLQAHAEKMNKRSAAEAHLVVEIMRGSTSGIQKMMAGTLGEIGIAIGKVSILLYAFQEGWRIGSKAANVVWEKRLDKSKEVSNAIAIARKEAELFANTIQEKVGRVVEGVGKAREREAKEVGEVRRREKIEMQLSAAREMAEVAGDEEKTVMKRIEIKDRENKMYGERIQQNEKFLKEIEMQISAYQAKMKEAEEMYAKAPTAATRERYWKIVEDTKKLIEVEKERYKKYEVEAMEYAKKVHENRAEMISIEKSYNEKMLAEAEKRMAKEKEEIEERERNAERIQKIQKEIVRIEEAEAHEQARAEKERMEKEIIAINEEIAMRMKAKEIEKMQREKFREEDQRKEDRLRRMMERGFRVSPAESEWLEKRELLRRRAETEEKLKAVREEIEKKEMKAIAENTKAMKEKIEEMKNEMKALLALQ